MFWGQIRDPSHMISVVTRCYPGHAIASPCLISPHRGGSRIFHRRGCTSNGVTDPQNFFCRIPVVLESRSSSQVRWVGVVRTPCTLPLTPPLHQAMFVRGRHSYSRSNPSAFFAVTILFKTQPVPNFPKGSKKGGQVSLAPVPKQRRS